MARGERAESEQRAALTPDLVLDAAMVVLERDGVNGLSMRGLANELRVGSPTIYWHVGNRDELLNQLIDRITDQLGSIEPTGTEPADRIASICEQVLAELRRRSQLVSLAYAQGKGEAILVQAQELIARELIAAGLRGGEGAFALSAILFQIGGFILFERAVSHDFRVRGASRWQSDEGRELGAYLEGGVDLDAIFDATLRAVLHSLLDERAVPRPA